MGAVSNSSRTDVPITQRMKEWAAHFRMRVQGFSTPPTFDELFTDLDQYETILDRHTGRRLADCEILEIGFGARPNRLVATISMGLNARGIDIDQPMLRGTLAEFTSIYRRNGPQRAVKTLVRHFLFDWHERRALSDALKRRGHRYRKDTARVIVARVAGGGG